MKKVVKGVTYNTESSKKIYDSIDAQLSNKLSTRHNVLCVTSKKEYFLHLYYSNALNEILAINRMRVEEIIPLTVESAVIWGQEWMPESDYIKHFLNEDSNNWTKQEINVVLTVQEIRLLNKISKLTGLTVSKLISNAIHSNYSTGIYKG